MARGLCRKCWPDGWPEGVFAAGCDHGSYERPKRLKGSAEPEPEPEPEPETEE